MTMPRFSRTELGDPTRSPPQRLTSLPLSRVIDPGLVGWEGCRESRRCSRDTYSKFFITKYTSIRRKIRTLKPVRSLTCFPLPQGRAEGGYRTPVQGYLAHKKPTPRFLQGRASAESQCGSRRATALERGRQPETVLERGRQSETVLERRRQPMKAVLGPLPLDLGKRLSIPSSSLLYDKRVK